MTTTRPTKAQTDVLSCLSQDGSRLIQPLVSGKAARLVAPDRGYTWIGTPTVHAMLRSGWIAQSDGLLVGVGLVYHITDAGRVEVAIAGGAHRVAWPCAECREPQQIQVQTYREIQRDGIGICCFQCFAKAFVDGERKRQALAAAAPAPASTGDEGTGA